MDKKKEKNDGSDPNFENREEQEKDKGKKKKNSDKYSDFNNDNKIYGFQNKRNNCYLNSSLQLLTRVKGLKESILNNKDKNGNKVTGGALFEEFRKILEDIQQNKKIIIPDYLKQKMGRIDDRYNYNRQEDANEFISNFLDALREETSDKYIINNNEANNFEDDLENEAYKKFYKKFYERRGYSFLLDLFYGNYITEKFCKKCRKKISVKFSAFNMIELPIYELAQKNKYCSLTLETILNSFFSESKIYGAICDICYREEIYCRTSIYKLPENLIIFFGRTANDQYISNNIDYSQTLDLDDYLYKKKYMRKYSLDCVIEHSGSSDFGHYTAICQIKPSDWYYFSDSFYHENNSYNSRNAIILLYKS